MSHDLFFHAREGNVPAPEGLAEYFGQFSSFSIGPYDEDGVRYSYENEVTGVYGEFIYLPGSGPDDGVPSGYTPTGVSFNINYVRASFFALEMMPVVAAFCHHFDLLVDDPQDGTVAPPDTEKLIRSWKKSNQSGVTGLLRDHDRLELQTSYLPESMATAWWAYTRAKSAIEEGLEEDMYVPRIFIMEGTDGDAFTMAVWPDAIPQFFPRCDYIYVSIEEPEKVGLEHPASGLMRYEDLMIRLGALLRRYDTPAGPILILPPDRAGNAEKMIAGLDLIPIDLAACSQLRPGSIHDVEVAAVKR